MKKIKAKTRKAVKARFKITANGKVMRRRKGLRHILTKMTSSKKRSLARPAQLEGAAADRVKKLIVGL
jgi:large subunit ribosomal protein L35